MLKGFEFLRINLQSRDNNNLKKEKFISKVKENTYFKAAFSFISEKNNKDVHYIELQMIKFSNEMLSYYLKMNCFKECIGNIALGK